MIRIVVLALVAAVLAIGQEQIEVASIKLTDPEQVSSTPLVHYLYDWAEMRSVTLKLLIQLAYSVGDAQISGGPSWLDSRHYDISAKVSDPGDLVTAQTPISQLTDEQRKANGERLRRLLRPLLADRFQLKVHPETIQRPLYILTVSKGGSKLADLRNQSGDSQSGGIRPGRGFLTASRIDISFFAKTLAQILGRTVADETGLTGKYSFTLKWTPDDSTPNDAFGAALPSTPPTAPAEANSGAPTIFAAVADLGLKLTSGKGPVDMIVIDRVEEPSEN